MRIGDWMSDVCSSDLPPAAAQFSDSYSFLQAVEKRDGDKATSLLTDNDTRVINTRNPDTGETALAIVVKRRDLTWLRFLLGKDADPSIADRQRSEEHTSELQSLMRISYAVFCLKKKQQHKSNIKLT